MFSVVRLQAGKGGFMPPYFNVNLLCCDCKSNPRMRSEHSPGITDRRKSLYVCPW